MKCDEAPPSPKRILYLVFSELLGMTILLFVSLGWYVSRRAMLIWFPDSPEAVARVGIWPLGLASVWILVHLIAWMATRRGNRTWYGHLALCLLVLNIGCGAVSVWYAWLFVASVLLQRGG